MLSFTHTLSDIPFASALNNTSIFINEFIRSVVYRIFSIKIYCVLIFHGNIYRSISSVVMAGYYPVIRIFQLIDFILNYEC